MMKQRQKVEERIMHSEVKSGAKGFNYEPTLSINFPTADGAKNYL